MTEFGSIEEIETQLKEYKQQREQIEALLTEDAENEDTLEIHKNLTEAITLIEELLSSANSKTPKKRFGSKQVKKEDSKPEDQEEGEEEEQQQVNQLDTNIPLGPRLPAAVTEQVRRNQIRAALSGSAPPQWAIGAKCEALSFDDQKWYGGIVKKVTDHGRFVILFDNNLETEQLDGCFVRPPSNTGEVYKGVEAPKRKRVEDEPVITEIPKWCQIRDRDSEKTVKKKKKLLKSYKSKIRFQKLDLDQKKKQKNWTDFIHGKGSKKKIGFFTGRQKDSIFKTNEFGRVGVVGSGKGMTDYQKRSRHEFQLEEGEDEPRDQES
eukprot:g4303.t1